MTSRFTFAIRAAAVAAPAVAQSATDDDRKAVAESYLKSLDAGGVSPTTGLGLFDHVTTNPPYLAAAVADPSPDRSKALATVESSADLVRWLTVAAGALKPAGTLLAIHRSDRLEEIVAILARLGWGDVTV
eukprot:gene16873-22892_t